MSERRRGRAAPGRPCTRAALGSRCRCRGSTPVSARGGVEGRAWSPRCGLAPISSSQSATCAGVQSSTACRDARSPPGASWDSISPAPVRPSPAAPTSAAAAATRSAQVARSTPALRALLRPARGRAPRFVARSARLLDTVAAEQASEAPALLSASWRTVRSTPSPAAPAFWNSLLAERDPQPLPRSIAIATAQALLTTRFSRSGVNEALRTVLLGSHSPYRCRLRRDIASCVSGPPRDLCRRGTPLPELREVEAAPGRRPLAGLFARRGEGGRMAYDTGPSWVSFPAASV